MMPLSPAFTNRCDTYLSIDGASIENDDEVARFETQAGPMFRNLNKILVAMCI